MSYIKPRFWPRDARDAAVGAAVGLLIPAALFTAAYLATRRLSVSVVSILAVWAAFALVRVRRLELDSDGIRFVRIVGWPRFLAWSDVVSIDPVGRGEVVVRGWLWPPFPPREATTSLTSAGHFRIRTLRGDRYFPPDSAVDFIQELKTHGRYAT